MNENIIWNELSYTLGSLAERLRVKAVAEVKRQLDADGHANAALAVNIAIQGVLTDSAVTDLNRDLGSL